VHWSEQNRQSHQQRQQRESGRTPDVVDDRYQRPAIATGTVLAVSPVSLPSAAHRGSIRRSDRLASNGFLMTACGRPGVTQPSEARERSDLLRDRQAAGALML